MTFPDPHPGATSAPAPDSGDLYRFAAPIYDLATLLWSGGAIWRSRVCQLDSMQPGERILYPGGGTGRAAVEAARRGMRVTFVDRSSAMFGRAQARAAREGVRLEWVQADLWDYEPEEPFDGICANHFFNVLDEPAMLRMQQRLVGFLKPEGKLYIADFRPLLGPWWLRTLQRIHHGIPLAGCSALTRNAMHPIYDHDLYLGSACESTQDHRVWWIGPGWYRTWVASAAKLQKSAPGQPT